MSRASLESRVRKTLTELVRIPSVSHQEDRVRDYLRRRLAASELTTTQDAAGNLLSTVPGRGDQRNAAPLLLNAHMDRVPPGSGCEPVIRDGCMFSDGSTNLGADDAAGITIIVLTIEELLRRRDSHRPIVVLFTVAEEVGLLGAKQFDPTPWNVHEGIVFDNAGAAGEVVRQGAAYIAFDITLHGRGGHPGKDLAHVLNAIDVFRRVPLSTGELDDGRTRVSLGKISGGSARNSVAEEVVVQGEIRTLRDVHGQEEVCRRIEDALVEAAKNTGGSVEARFTPLAASYEVSEQGPLLQAFRDAWEQQSAFRTLASFVASDANALRDRLHVFTVSTGVADEHMVQESVAIQPLARLVETSVDVISSYR